MILAVTSFLILTTKLGSFSVNCLYYFTSLDLTKKLIISDPLVKQTFIIFLPPF